MLFSQRRTSVWCLKLSKFAICKIKEMLDLEGGQRNIAQWGILLNIFKKISICVWIPAPKPVGNVVND